MSGQTYFAIIGDVVGTNEVEDRSNLQQRLRVAELGFLHPLCDSTHRHE